MKKLQIATAALFAVMLAVFCAVMLYHGTAVDKNPPQLSCDSEELVISVSDPESALLAGVHARDDRDGDLTAAVMIKSISQLITDDTAQVTYIVFDSSNNMATLTRRVRYSDYEKPRFALSAPLNFTVGDKLALLDRLTARDVVDGDISGSICVISQNVKDEPGVYTVTVQVTNSLGDAATLPLKLVVSQLNGTDCVELTDYLIYLEQGSEFHAQDYVRGATQGLRVEGTVDTRQPGVYHVRYSRDGQEKTADVYLTVVVA